MTMEDTAAEPQEPLIEIVGGTVVASGYPYTEPGAKRWVARCSCGWSTSRHYSAAIDRQVAKHRKAVA